MNIFFYITNSLVITDVVFNKFGNHTSTASGRIAGMCCSGKRTCHATIQEKIKSSKQFGLRAQFNVRESWFRCITCMDIQNHNPYCSKFFLEEIHKETCV